MASKLARAGLKLSEEETLKRPPRGLEDVSDPEIAAAMRRKTFICLRPVPESAIVKPALVDDFCAFASDSLPLLAWGWDALSDSR